MNLNFDMTLAQLYVRDGLLALDGHFLQALEAAAPPLKLQLQQARSQPEALTPLQESQLLLTLGPYLEGFVARLFRIETQVSDLSQRHHALAPLYAIKRKFVQRTAAKKINAEQAESIDGAALQLRLRDWFGGQFDELVFATQVQAWLEDETGNAEKIDVALHYAAWALHTEAGKAAHRGGILFRLPHAVDDMHLVPGA
ncbi:MAG TPA: pyridine nucleotide-disulfide oxidoreductase, partial [Oxalobacteraceae bacterium]|nr:pyridine nucleotide-disulfide oxidoreductase [Oxalobacteraceae bacterium]